MEDRKLTTAIFINALCEMFQCKQCVRAVSHGDSIYLVKGSDMPNGTPVFVTEPEAEGEPCKR